MEKKVVGGCVEISKRECRMRDRGCIELTYLNARQQPRQFHLETTLSTLDDTLHEKGREGTPLHVSPRLRQSSAINSPSPMRPRRLRRTIGGGTAGGMALVSSRTFPVSNRCYS